MTPTEIYNAVVWNLWGNTGAPAGVAENINRIIESCHRQVQQDYNYWFMHTWASIDCVAGTQAYQLPDGFKEYITCLWLLTDTADEPIGFSNILNTVGMGDAQQYLWQQDTTWEMETPEYVEITGGNIVLYPDLSEDKTLYLVYWMFLGFPTATVENDLTLYGDQVLVNMATYKTAAFMKEFDLVEYYKAEYLDCLERLKNEDRRRRQAQINWVDGNLI